MLRNADWGGGVKFSEKKHYEGVMFNIISVTERVGPISRKKCYVTLEWPLKIPYFLIILIIMLSLAIHSTLYSLSKRVDTFYCE